MGVCRQQSTTPFVVLGLVLLCCGCNVSALHAFQILPSAGTGADNVVVNTTNGPLLGVVDGGDVAAFLKIPFAAPPVGDNRFRAPQPVSPWGPKPYNATQFGLECPQLRLFGDVTLHKSSEDCLYLAVWAPLNASGPLPVMFWVHGGGFIIGDDDGNGRYVGAHLARTHNVVVVGVNYRLGGLGFLAHKAFQEEDPHGSTGSYGIQDQRQGLQWARDHVSLFGGDPSQVLLFGQSAGAFSVCTHLASPASAGLFHAAIMESGTCDSAWFFPELDFAMAFGDGFTAAIGCNSSTLTSDEFRKCMRALPDDSMIGPVDSWWSPSWPRTSGPPLPVKSALAPVMSWGVAVDGTDVGLPTQPLAAILSGKYNKVPVIAGTNSDEGSLFVPAFWPIAGTSYPMKSGDLTKALNHISNNHTVVDEILLHYPSPSYKSDDARMAAIIRDACLACPTRRLHNALSENQGTSYTYRFTYAPPSLEGDLFGVFHSAEIPYVFGNPKDKEFKADEVKVSELLEYYWTNFAHTLSPNTPPPHTSPAVNPIKWPQFDPSTQAGVYLNTDATPMTGLETAICDFWDSFYPKHFC